MGREGLQGLSLMGREGGLAGTISLIGREGRLAGTVSLMEREGLQGPSL